MVVVVMFGSEKVGRPQAELQAKDVNRRSVGAYDYRTEQ